MHKNKLFLAVGIIVVAVSLSGCAKTKQNVKNKTPVVQQNVNVKQDVSKEAENNTNNTSVIEAKSEYTKITNTTEKPNGIEYEILDSFVYKSGSNVVIAIPNYDDNLVEVSAKANDSNDCTELDIEYNINKSGQINTQELDKQIALSKEKSALEKQLVVKVNNSLIGIY